MDARAGQRSIVTERGTKYFREIITGTFRSIEIGNYHRKNIGTRYRCHVSLAPETARNIESRGEEAKIVTRRRIPFDLFALKLHGTEWNVAIHIFPRTI